MDLAGRFSECFTEGTLYEPMYWIFLAATEETTVQRIKHRGGTHELLNMPATIGYLQRFRWWFANNLLQENEFSWISTDLLSLEQLASLCQEFSVTISRPRPPTSGLRAMLQSLSKETSMLEKLLNI